jgi:hypothetical protein
MAHSDEIRRLLDMNESAEALALVPLEDFAAAYCRYFVRETATEDTTGWDDDPDGWAAQLYFDLTETGYGEEWSDDHEERLRRFLMLIVDGAANDDVLEYIGAGPFEDFLALDEGRVAWVEAQAAASPKFRKALANVWIASWAPEETFLRIEAAAQVPLAWPEQYGARPGDRDCWHQTPEEAAVAGFFKHQKDVTLVGARVRGDQARVWLLTRLYQQYTIVGLEFDPGPFEEYECVCVREDRLWRTSDRRSRFSAQTPTEIRERADAIRSEAS